MPLRVLGIDPGFDRCGLGVVDLQGATPTWVWHGCVQTSAKDDFSTRLQQIRDGVTMAIRVHRPAAVAVESLFFQKNVTTALQVGMARGVIFLAIADAKLPVVEITPNQVKQGISGYGGADKKQMQQMVQRLLKLSAPPTPDDAADALAIAMVGGLLARHPRR